MDPKDIQAQIEKDIRDQLMGVRKVEEATAPPIEIKTIERVLKPGQTMFSKLLSIKKLPSAVKDFPVTTFNDTDWSIEMRSFLGTCDPNYIVQIEEAAYILQGFEDNDKTMIVGPTGAGKSTLVEYLCALVRRPFLRINLQGDIESSALFGQLVVEDGATVWKDGPVTEGVRYGAVVLFDEWELMPSEIGMSMQWLLEDRGRLFLKEKPGPSGGKMIIPHAEFRLVYAGNTVGQGDETGRHAGVQVQNTATIDRFSTVVHLGYLSAKHETAILNKVVPDLDGEVIKKMLQYAELVRSCNQQNNITLTMSPRTLINWGKKITRSGNIKEALIYSFLNKMNGTDKKVAMEFYVKVFG